MRELAGMTVDGAPAAQDAASGALFIITLKASTAPMALEVPTLPELAGLAVFRSRKVEDGSERFRLHLGYFESTDSAEAVLPVIREHFPAAWVGPAPNSGLGSLDDTSVAQFKFIKAPNTIAQGSTSTRLRALNAAPSKPVPAEPAPPSVKAVTKTPPKAVVTAPPTVQATARIASPPPIAPKAVLSLLESGSTPAPQLTEQTRMQPRERAAVIGAIQRFAVQLVWSTNPVNLTDVPKLAIFDAYTLYKVQVDRAGRRWYGLRLGFFADPVSARQVSLYARSDFTAAAVVPVSDRECDRATQAAVKELPDAAPAKKESLDMQLVDLPRGPQVDLDALAADRERQSELAEERQRARPFATPAAKPSAKAAAKPAAAKSSATNVDESPTQKQRRMKSTAELAADLHTEPAFDLDTGDALNDTGVRHLAVKVMKKDSKLGKLFKRDTRR